MKSNKASNSLVVAASAILFVEVVLPLLSGLLELMNVKLSKCAVYDQVEISKVSNSLEKEPTSHPIGFSVNDVD